MTRAAILRATVTALGMHSALPVGVDTGLGWTANRAYLVYDAGTVATSAPGTRQPITKDQDGWCVGVYLTNFNQGWAGDGWAGVALISTVPGNVTGNAPSGLTNGFSHLGLYWYVHWTAQNDAWGGADYYDTGLPELDLNGAYQPPNASMTQEIFETIMEASGVRLLPKVLTMPVLTAGRA